MVFSGAVVHYLDISRSVDEILRVLSTLKTVEMCSVEWKDRENPRWEKHKYMTKPEWLKES